MGAINAAIESFVPAAERAAVAGQLFGEEGSIAMSRIDTATLRQATEDVLAFGVVVSEQDADQIERTNDAISRLGLIWRGLSNQLAVAAAPALEAVADAMAAVASRTGPLGIAMNGVVISAPTYAPSCLAAPWTTTEAFSSAPPPAPPACLWPPKWPPAKKTTSASAYLAKRAASTGSRRTTTAS